MSGPACESIIKEIKEIKEVKEVKEQTQGNRWRKVGWKSYVTIQLSHFIVR